MEALADVDKKFGLGKRSEHEAKLRTADERIGGAGIGRCKIRQHRGIVKIAAPADDGAQPVGPVQRILSENSDTALLHRVAADRRKELALHGIVEVQPDIVIAALHADFGFHRHANELAREGVRRVDTAQRAVVVQMELIAIETIDKKVCEIVPEVERTLDY